MSIDSATQFNTYVKRTILSGVKPIEIYFQPIEDCYTGDALAYRLITVINSVVTGVLYPDDYFYQGVDDKLLLKLSFRALKKALVFSKKLFEAGVNVKFLSVRFPASCVYEEDFFQKLDKVLSGAEGDKEVLSRLVIELDRTASENDGETLSAFFKGIKTTGLKSALTGYGGGDFSIEKLMNACPDFLFTDENLSKLILDREKRGAIGPLISFAKSLGAEVVAENVGGDIELKELRYRASYAFIPSKEYKGVIEAEKNLKTFDDVLGGGQDYD